MKMTMFPNARAAVMEAEAAGEVSVSAYDHAPVGSPSATPSAVVGQAIDYSAGQVSIAALKGNHITAILRYLSLTPSKDLTAAELVTAMAGGIGVATVWETTADRTLAGSVGGVADAQTARAHARALGKPDNRPIYFAVDFDAAPSQMPTILDYCRGFSSVLGGPSQTGAYGGYWVVKYLSEQGACDYLWQSLAWSGGLWHPAAQLQQYAFGRIYGGVDCDVNRIVRSDFGQWFSGSAPSSTVEAVATELLVLRLGARGRDVSALQRLLKIPDDSVFGPFTDKAVRAAQARYGLTVDGIVGEQTWKRLLNP